MAAFQEATSAHVQNLNFTLWKPRLGRAPTIRNTRKFSLYFSTYIFTRHCLYFYFFLSNLVWYLYLPYLPLFNRSISPGLWCGLHYMSVCIVKPYVLQEWVIGGEGRRREEFWGVQLLSVLYIKNPNSPLVPLCTSFSYRSLQYEQLKRKHSFFVTKSLFAGI